jgi:nucleotide-binding universal stress UspA family protein
MYDRLLVPVDDSDGARAALAHAIAVAGDTDATVDVMTVVETDRIARLFGQDAEAARERAKDLLADLSAGLDHGSASLATYVAEGRPERAIRDFAAENESDLLAMGRHGPHGLRERALGDVTDRVLRHADAPVLTVRGETVPDPEEVAVDAVLVPTDGSEAAAAAADDAAELARRFDATLHVVSALDLQAEGGLFDAGGLPPEFVERAEDRHREAAEQLADVLRERVDTAVETTVERGRAHTVLAEYVDAQEIDLVVMGRQGRSRVEAGLLGSVTTRVLRTVDEPVVVVPAGG